MKKKLLISAILLTAVTAFIFNKPSAEINSYIPPAGMTDTFLVGFMQSAGQLNYSYYDSLETNITQSYCGTVWDNTLQRHVPIGWLVANDSLLSPVKTDALRAVLNNAYSHKQNRYIWMRPKLEWLAYGQSSTYEAEEITGGDRWFYAFQNRSGQSVEDSSRMVLHCGMPTMSGIPSCVLKRLKANTEQSRRTIGNNETNHWQGDSECDWYIKPRIRIDSNFAHNNPTTPVCSIKVIAQNGQTVLKNVILRGRNFWDQFDNYDGRYLEKFRIFQGDDTLLIHGDWGDKWNYAARGNMTQQEEQNDPDVNHADIQVWWYDNCDMWLDYVKVENDVAHNLLTSDTTNQTHQLYNQWLTDEVAAVNVHPYIYNFYIELFEYNNIPCMAYVNRKLDSLSGGTMGLMADQLTLYQCHLARNERGTIVSAEQIRNNYVDVVGSKQVFIGDPYPITAAYPNGCYGSTSQYSRIPSTLPVTTANNILADTISPAGYDAWLQNLFDTLCTYYEGGEFNEANCCPLQLRGVFGYLMKHGHQISKECNIPFIAMLQAHQWVKFGEVEREPTNEELDVMTNIAVSYGARGILYWMFPSFRDVNNPDCHYTYGIIDSTEQHPRYTNVYGQEKWKKVVELTKRLKNKWGTKLMSFNNADRHTYIYRLERQQCLNESYFFDIITYKPGSSQPCVDDNPLPGQNPPTGLIYECYEDRYLQVATFKESSTERRTYPYFMIVNRRCSPYISELNENTRGGKRNVRVIFDASHAELSGYNNWEIINVEDDSVVGSFNKTVLKLVNLGDFMPGEGRLYHLVPTAKSGGIMLGDELIESGEDFTCEDTVWTNGYDLTIEDGVTINFSDSAKFIVHGGTFQMGSPQHSGPNTINMDAAPGNSWKGFEFNNATVKIYGVNFSGLANDSIAMLTMIDCPLIDLRYNSFSLGIFQF